LKTLQTNLNIIDVYDGTRDDILVWVRLPAEWDTYRILCELARLFQTDIAYIEILGGYRLKGKKPAMLFSIRKVLSEF